MTASGTAFDRALDLLGRAIVDGELPVGHTDTIEGLVERAGVSRSVVREVTRVLGSLGMLSAGRRVGLRVLGGEHWDVLDPLVIRWRLHGPEPQEQIDELRALRHAIEPAAAAAAATAVQRGQRETQTLEDAITAMRRAAGAPEAAAFLQADRALHAAVLGLSANSMFTRLRAVIDEGLQERALRERAELLPDPHDVELHGRVAEAILGGDAEAAASAMREIVERTTRAAR
ncbi:FadR/GntR family transcriptional regulator [Brachybacterium sp. FME24]|uniref:FadR/GntR family transcriptional regulator n=1 Tax=Brachybacterium sp. FME24 TaxID=2742605 RepID=UPI0018689814|nr:FCD domain-containing protein [Brachybacterium sp. FME24]